MARPRKQRTEFKVREQESKKWQICIYIRLSKEDGKTQRQSQSESIKNQKSILISWIEDYFVSDRYEIVDVFEDDGLTGTDDSRKEFKRMLEVIEKGEGNCVVVKTLSRAFRNYADQGYYLEEYFPSRNVRFISTMDSFIDTYADSEAIYNLDVPMYGVLNDRFAASTSRAVRKTLDDKRRKGKFIGAFAPWGFLKDPKDKNRLILDPETAPIKVQMKDWLLHEGMSLAGVARKLNDLGVPNPTKYKQLKGWNYQNPNILNNDGLWTGDTVKRVIFNLMNVGWMVQGKQKVVSYKIHEKTAVPKEKWCIVKNTHEAVFSEEDYRALERLFEKDTRTANGNGKVHLFAGFVRCADCQKAMQRSHSNGLIYYKCRTRAEKSEKKCKVHSIREDRLKEAVLKAIQLQVEKIKVSDVREKLEQSLDSDPRTGYLEQSLEAKRKEQEKEKELYDGLYEDWKAGVLCMDEYRRMRENYRKKIICLENNITSTESELRSTKEKLEKRKVLYEEFLEGGKIKELTRSVLLAFVDTIYIHENKELTIRFLFEEEKDNSLPEIKKTADKQLQRPVQRAQAEDLWGRRERRVPGEQRAQQEQQVRQE